MKKISITDYHKNMGTLIDLSSKEDFIISHHPDAINIPYQKFMLYYDGYLKIPNKELMQEFEKALEDESFGYVSKIIEN